MFQPNRDAQQVVGGARSRMLNGGSMLYEALDPAETGGACKDLDLGGHCHRRLPASSHLKSEHTAKELHLTFGNFMAGMIWQARVVDHRNARVLVQELCHLKRLLRLRANPPGERAHAALNQP